MFFYRLSSLKSLFSIKTSYIFTLKKTI